MIAEALNSDVSGGAAHTHQPVELSDVNKLNGMSPMLQHRDFGGAFVAECPKSHYSY